MPATNTTEQPQLVEVQSSRIVHLAWMAMTVLVFASIVRHVLNYNFTNSVPAALTKLFNLNGEKTFAALFSTAILAFAAMLLGLITLDAFKRGRQYVWHWFGLTIIFAYLAADELLAIHEAISRLIAKGSSIVGELTWALWVLPFGILVLVFGLVYLRFLMSLAPVYRIRFIIAELVYVGGALGFEIIGAMFVASYGGASIGHDILVILEETLEMSGIILWISALLTYLTNETVGLTFTFTPLRDSSRVAIAETSIQKPETV